MLARPRLLVLIILGIFLIGTPLTYLSGEARAAAPASLVLVDSTPNRVLLKLQVPGYTLDSLVTPTAAYQRLNVPGADQTSVAGAPELPIWNASLGVPAGAQVTVRVLEAASTPIPGTLRLAPVATPVRSGVDLQPGRTVLTPDPAAYRRPTAYPATLAHVAADSWQRDQRVVRVELAPFQYLAATGRLIWHREITVEVAWTTPVPVSTQLAPASAFEPIFQQTLLNYAQARRWRTAATAPADLALAQPPQTRYKIVVDRDAMYRVTYADLQAAGMPVNSIDPRTFRLTSQGQDVAIRVPGEADGRFDAADLLLFYGQKYQTEIVPDTLILSGTLTTAPSIMSADYSNATTYTDENVYWLTVGAAAGPRMAEVNGTPIGTTPVPQSYRTTARAEQSNRWLTTHFTNRDTWFWARIDTTSSIVFTATTTLSALAATTQPAVVRSEVVALNYNAAASPDHRTQFALYNPVDRTRTLLEDATWDGLERHRVEVPVAQSSLLNGLNYLEFTTIRQPALAAEIMYFDWFEIEYSRRFEALANTLTWQHVPTGTWQYQINGFSSNLLQAYDISNPLLPRSIINLAVSPPVSGLHQLSFNATHGPASRYTALAADALQSPKRLSSYTPPDLRSTSNRADYILITHPAFLSATQTLANYRAADGMRTAVVSIDDVYNEFNDGIYHPVAIKRFLAYAYANWQGPPPSYVLLVGDGHWNFKDFNPPLYGGAGQYIPPMLAWVDPYQGEVDSTNLLAALVGNDYMPDLSIGRLPVNSAAEAQAAVAKIIAFESAPSASWQRHMLFVADNIPDPAGDFVALSEAMIADAVPATWAADRIYLNAICGAPNGQPCPAMNTAIISTLNTTGTLFLNYAGHGSVNRWAGESIFVNANIAALTNGARLPIVLSMTCLDGYWPHPKITGLMEELVRSPNRGAVASFAATGLGVADGHDIMQRAFYAAIFEGNLRRLGPATVAGKFALAQTGFHTDLINTFVVIGDPALKLPIPAEEFPLYLPYIVK